MKMRMFFLSMLLALTSVIPVLLHAEVPNIRIWPDGSLLKGPNSDAVYYISGINKHAFPDAKTFFTWNLKFSDVQAASITELDGYRTGLPMYYRAGTKLITHPNTNRVYAAEPNGRLRWIPNEQTALSLYGPAWASRVQDVHELTFGTYAIEGDVVAPFHPVGTILQDGATLYRVTAGNVLRSINGAFLNNRLNPDDTVQVSDVSMYTIGTPYDQYDLVDFVNYQPPIPAGN